MYSLDISAIVSSCDNDKDVDICTSLGISIVAMLLTLVLIDDTSSFLSYKGRNKSPSLGALKRDLPLNTSFIYIYFVIGLDDVPVEFSLKDPLILLFFLFFLLFSFL